MTHKKIQLSLQKILTDNTPMTLKQLYSKKNMGKIAYKICYNNKIRTLKALLRHGDKHHTFENLHGCDERINNEILRVYLQHSIHKLKNNETPPLTRIISNLNCMQRDIIALFIDNHYWRMPKRAQNAILKYLDNDLSVENINEKILSNDSFSSREVRSVGILMAKEVDTFTSKLRHLITEVSQIYYTKDLNAFKIKMHFERIYPSHTFPDVVFSSQSIFRMADYLINNELLFQGHNNAVLKNGINIYLEPHWFTPENFSKEIGLSKERVRQILRGNLNMLDDKLQVIKYLDDPFLKVLGIDDQQDFIHIDNSLFLAINKEDDLYFTRQFCTYLIYLYLSDHYDLIGEMSDVLIRKDAGSRTRHYWKNFYLLSKSISHNIDHLTLVDDISRRRSKRNTRTYSLPIKKLIAKHSKYAPRKIPQTVCQFTEILLKNELKVPIDEDKNVIIERNTLVLLYEYSRKALEALGKPAHFEEICEKANELFPDNHFNPKQVQTSMKRELGFTPISRSGYFGLKEWENIDDGFKGGTIREIIQEYLNENNRPIHIHELYPYIKKFRPNTYSRSIYDNLKLDASGKFIIFKHKFIGLSKKTNKYNVEKYRAIPQNIFAIVNNLMKKGYTKNNIRKFMKEKYGFTKKETDCLFQETPRYNKRRKK